MNKLKNLAFLLASAYACLTPTARAQVVTAPTLDSATLHARLERSVASKAMPTDVATLDSMLQTRRYAQLKHRLLRTPDNIHQIESDMNWEEKKIYDGAGFFISYWYMTEIWSYGSAGSLPNAKDLKSSAATMFFYNFILVHADGFKCTDLSAPGHRMDQIGVEARPIILFLKTLSKNEQVQLADQALQIKLASGPLRADDEVLCSGGAAQMAHDLSANKEIGNTPLNEAMGKTYVVPADPNYKPGFVAPEIWRPKQEQVRKSAPEALNLFLQKLDSTPFPATR